MYVDECVLIVVIDSNSIVVNHNLATPLLEDSRIGNLLLAAVAVAV